MAKGSGNQRRPEDDRASVQRLFATLAGEDPDTVRAVLRDNPALAEAVLGSAELQRLLRAVAAEPASPLAGSPAPQVDPPRFPAYAEPQGIFTELTRELSPERAEQLFRKIAPLVVYELLRALDQNTNIGTVQQVVDHLCSPAVQDRLRACAHVRDGILDELAAVLRDAGLRTAIDRAGIQALMEDCGAAGELKTLVNCIRFTQAAG